MPELDSYQTEIGRIGEPYWPLIVGTDGGQVILHMAGGEFYLSRIEAEEFAQLLVRACWLAAQEVRNA